LSADRDFHKSGVPQLRETSSYALIPETAALNFGTPEKIFDLLISNLFWHKICSNTQKSLVRSKILQEPGFPFKKTSRFRIPPKKLLFREKSKNEATDFYPESAVFGAEQKKFHLLLVLYYAPYSS
jgi:hypothetical protein